MLAFFMNCLAMSLSHNENQNKDCLNPDYSNIKLMSSIIIVRIQKEKLHFFKKIFKKIFQKNFFKKPGLLRDPGRFFIRD